LCTHYHHNHGLEISWKQQQQQQHCRRRRRLYNEITPSAAAPISTLPPAASVAIGSNSEAAAKSEKEDGLDTRRSKKGTRCFLN
jgi:hypothetical protein